MEHSTPVNPQPEIPRGLAQKAYIAGQIMRGSELANPAAVANQARNPLIIKNNFDREIQEGSASRLLVRHQLSPKAQNDVFDLPAVAATLVDNIVGEAENPEIIDFVVAMHSFQQIAGAVTADWSEATRRRQWPRFKELSSAFAIELAGRMPIVIKDGDYTMVDLYNKIFGEPEASSDPEQHQDTARAVDQYFNHVSDRTRLATFIFEGGFSPGEGANPNPYNKPLNSKEIQRFNADAAETIERLHLLKAYEITPMIVPGATVELPWDIAVLPPLEFVAGEETGEYDPGALADFAFLPPDENRSEAYTEVKDVEGRSYQREISVGGSKTIVARFRLHDNGQISYGHALHNVPGDQAETLFAAVRGLPAFVRLRGLMIAITFDTMVPAEVVRTNAGGSVARRYRELREEAPRREPIQDLLLQRVNEMNRQRIGRENRQPATWEIPQHDVRGHMRDLPEGMRSTPQAEEEARKHYRRLGKKFDGIPEGKTFVKAHTRGNAPENTTFRRAKFRSKSVTARYLGDLGLK